MKVIGEFNNVSPQIMPKKLKKDEVVEYQLLCGTRDSKDPSKILYPTSFRIPSKDRIHDTGTGKFVDIGVYDEQRTRAHGSVKDGNILTKAIFIRGAKGLIGLTGGKIEDQELFEFFELTNTNESNSSRDDSIVPLFKRIDKVNDSKISTKHRSKRTQAMVYVDSLSEKDIRELAAALKWDEKDELIVLKDKLGDFAEKKPDAFITFIEAPGVKDMALIKFAITKGIIKYDVSTHKILWPSGETIAILDRADGKTEIENFSDWVLTAKNGGDVMTSIRKKMTAFIKEANRPEPVAE
jgi:hypothetical protein